MADSTLRFLHAGAFRLDEPLDGLSDPPAEWLDLLADAPYTAAQHVFATAMAEEVDFLLLVGRLLDPHRAGPRGMAFLLDQFEQLGVGIKRGGTAAAAAALVAQVRQVVHVGGGFSGGATGRGHADTRQAGLLGAL